MEKRDSTPNFSIPCPRFSWTLARLEFTGRSGSIVIDPRLLEGTGGSSPGGATRALRARRSLSPTGRGHAAQREACVLT
eukprot:878613-Pyramimonas_sp.AAC.1